MALISSCNSVSYALFLLIVEVFDTEHSYTSVHENVEYIINIVPELDDKPPAPGSTPNLTKAPEGKPDPFEPANYSDGQCIKNLGQYALLNNSNAMFPEHIMLVPTKFRPQASDLVDEDLVVIYRMLSSWAEVQKPFFCFFNGGPLAGASQPHLHAQFIPFQHGKPPPLEQAAIDAGMPDLGKPYLLPLRHVHYAVRLPSISELPPDSLLSVLSQAYKSLLSIVEEGKSKLGEEALPTAGQKRDSYNLMITTQHMHLVPRSKSSFTAPREESEHREKEGEVDVDGDGIGDMELAINGLAYAGLWFLPTEHEHKDLETYGIDKALAKCGYERDEWPLE